jgi:hypothetical protein
LGRHDARGVGGASEISAKGKGVCAGAGGCDA